MPDQPPKCPNGHPANSEGNCFDDSRYYANSRRHDGSGHGGPN